jgi:hypothetical protein
MSQSIPPYIAITYQPKVTPLAGSAPAPDQFPDTTKMVSLSSRIALAVCPRRRAGAQACPAPCDDCRAVAAAAAHEIADYFSERYGGASTTADTLYAVGCHHHAPQVEGLALSPNQRAMALAVGREVRRPNV